MIAIAARREASRTASTDFGDRGQVSKLSPPGNNGARAVQRDAPYEGRSRTPPVNQPSSRQGAFRITRPPPLRFGEPRRSQKSKETLSEARQHPPRAVLDLVCAKRQAGSHIKGTPGTTTLREGPINVVRRRFAFPEADGVRRASRWRSRLGCHWGVVCMNSPTTLWSASKLRDSRRGPVFLGFRCL